jgi:hypothetical protein
MAAYGELLMATVKRRCSLEIAGLQMRKQRVHRWGPRSGWPSHRAVDQHCTSDVAAR